MMNNDEMVNHPSHYEKSDGHPECIELLESLVTGYSGIAAGDIMQFKYLYRAGSKSESNMTQKGKAIQDIQKIIWYMNDFNKRAAAKLYIGDENDNDNDDDYLPLGFRHKDDDEPRKYSVDVLMQEFSFDKDDSIKEYVKKAIELAYNLQTFKNVFTLIEMLRKIVNILQSSSSQDDEV